MAKSLVKYSVVDAFTESPFKGNPAAVCFLEEEKSDDWLQAVAAEFNISETGYLNRIPGAAGRPSPPRFRLRWFTPIVEVPEAKTSSFSETQNGEASPFFIELDFPLVPSGDYNGEQQSLISKALNKTSIIEMKMTAADDLLVVFSSAEEVESFQPQFDEIIKCPGNGLLITAAAPPESRFDFYSRVFYPKLGINEDPVTGSAHCALAPYWSKKLGKDEFVANAASPRGGVLNLQLDEKNQRVLLRGKAVTVMEGSILV